MNELFRHIRFLLRYHECVIVPDFGAFMCSRLPAYFDIDSNSIFPPSKEFFFNPAIKHGDGIIVNSIARRENISFEEASLVLAGYIADFRNELTQKGEIYIQGVGKLTLCDEQRIIFKSAYSPIQYATSRGLLPYTFKSSNVSLANANIDNSSNRYYKIPKAIVHAVAAVIAAIFISISVLYSIGSSNYTNSKQMASVVPLKTSIQKAQPECAPEMPIIVEQQFSNSQHEINNISSAPALPIEEPQYHLIVGTFRSEQGAQSFIETNANSQFPLEVIQSGSMYRISAASDSEKEPLQNMLNSASFSSLFPGAWIYSVRASK